MIRVLGGGWYGCHVARALRLAGHEVILVESGRRLFSGASGANPARLHLGFHYPRSKLTRAACQDHQAEFMRHYGFLTRGVATNLYAVAAGASLVDFGTYKQVLAGEVQYVEVDPRDFDLYNVEGVLLTGERHLVIEDARRYFEAELAGTVSLGEPLAKVVDDPAFSWTIDCTFCANDAEGIDRYEPCVVGILSGPTNRAVTIMDGPFPSIYPWHPARGLSTISSALLTPLSKTCKTYDEAQAALSAATHHDLFVRVEEMRQQMRLFWPLSYDLYKPKTYKTAVRAMPRSAADARLVDVVRVGERALRVRAGKIDAIFAAARMVQEVIA